MRLIQAKLSEPAVQEQLEEVQMFNDGFVQWQTAATQLKRSPAYLQQIQQMHNTYLDTGELPPEAVITAIQRDYDQAEQLSAQAEWTYGDA
jgi:hypothetical protein